LWQLLGCTVYFEQVHLSIIFPFCLSLLSIFSNSVWWVSYFVFIYIYIYIYTRMCVCMFIHVHMYVHIHVAYFDLLHCSVSSFPFSLTLPTDFPSQTALCTFMSHCHCHFRSRFHKWLRTCHIWLFELGLPHPVWWSLVLFTSVFKFVLKSFVQSAFKQRISVYSLSSFSF
jgi:hypothetical protein